MLFRSFGNWFNGELFGKPTSLPWALEIPISNRPIGFENYQTFHPTFLYEAIWCLLVGGYLLRQKIKFRGQIFWSYIWLYSLGRLLVESIRIDYSHLIFGIRFNILVSAFFVILGAWQNLKFQKRALG